MFVSYRCDFSSCSVTLCRTWLSFLLNVRSRCTEFIVSGEPGNQTVRLLPFRFSCPSYSFVEALRLDSMEFSDPNIKQRLRIWTDLPYIIR